MAANEPESTQRSPTGISRRSFLFTVGAVLNGIAATLLAIPRDPVCLLELPPQCRVAVMDHARSTREFS